MHADAHRPYPAPRGPAAMVMHWHDLLFMHYRVDAARLRPFIPPSLTIEEFDGSAWIAVVPFRMAGVRHRFLPPIPGASAFPELNVRTYVRARDGHPGVWFFSLDADHRLAVSVARRTYRLAYMNASMSCRREGRVIRYSSRRTGPHNTLTFGTTRSASAEYRALYEPVGPEQAPAPGSLEHFLTGRYCLYAHARGTLYRAEIDHEPWPLQRARADVERNTMLDQVGLSELTAVPPLLHYADHLRVLAWLPRAVT